MEPNLSKDRAHILEGLKKALDHIDAVIKTIKASRTKEIAHAKLRTKFNLSSKQTDAILEMKLQTLAGLERKKIEDELEEKKKLITELETILKSKKKILDIVQAELLELKRKFGDERKTRIYKNAVGEFTSEDLIPKEQITVALTRDGYIKRLPTTAYKAQKRGGKGILGMSTKDADVVKHFFTTNTHADMLFFTNQGRVFQTKAYEIPESSRQAKGQAIVNFLQLAPEEAVTAIIPIGQDTDTEGLVMTTRLGITKRVEMDEFKKVRRTGLIAINLKKGDELRWVQPASGKDEVVITTKKGQAIRFKETDVRTMGRNAAGVRGIKLKGDDKVIAMDTISVSEAKSSKTLTITANGFGKLSEIENYKVQNRGGSGIKTAQVTGKTGEVISAHIINDTEYQKSDIIIITLKGQVIRTPLKNISVLGRATQGVRIMRLKDQDQAANVTKV